MHSRFNMFKLMDDDIIVHYHDIFLEFIGRTHISMVMFALQDLDRFDVTVYNSVRFCNNLSHSVRFYNNLSCAI